MFSIKIKYIKNEMYFMIIYLFNLLFYNKKSKDYVVELETKYNKHSLVITQLIIFNFFLCSLFL